MENPIIINKSYKLNKTTSMRVNFNPPISNLSSTFIDIPKDTIVNIFDPKTHKYYEQNEFHKNYFLALIEIWGNESDNEISIDTQKIINVAKDTKKYNAFVKINIDNFTPL